MASVYRDGDQWVADFRPVGGVKKQRRKVRIKARQLPNDSEAAALAYAKECDRYCRVLEVAPQRPEDIDHAERIRAITSEQAAELRAYMQATPTGDRLANKNPTLREAAWLHPATLNDQKTRERDCALNFKHLDAFAAFAGVTLVAEVTTEMAIRWVDQLRKDGVSWDGRQHRLRYLKRACVMGATLGLPNVLPEELRINRRVDGEDDLVVEAWTLDELGRGAVLLDDLRAKVALGLGGFVGLRPSESYRPRCCDVAGGLLDLTKIRTKNRRSKRMLPLPPTVAAWCAELAAGRPPEEPLIMSRVRGRQKPFSEATWAHWLAPLLAAATGRALPPKCLRKAFTTWAPAVLAGRDVERFTGHADAFLAPVSSTRYQAARAAEELRPAAALIERELRAAMKRAEASAEVKQARRDAERTARAAAAARKAEQEARAAAYRQRQNDRRKAVRAAARALRFPRAVSTAS